MGAYVLQQRRHRPEGLLDRVQNVVPECASRRNLDSGRAAAVAASPPEAGSLPLLKNLLSLNSNTQQQKQRPLPTSKDAGDAQRPRPHPITGRFGMVGLRLSMGLLKPAGRVLSRAALRAPRVGDLRALRAHHVQGHPQSRDVPSWKTEMRRFCVYSGGGAGSSSAFGTKKRASAKTSCEDLLGRLGGHPQRSPEAR